MLIVGNTVGGWAGGTSVTLHSVFFKSKIVLKNKLYHMFLKRGNPIS